MKITISFSEEEKRISTEMMLNTSNIKEVVDKDENYAGRFGTMKYDKNKNVIEIDLKTAFIRATAGLTIGLVNMAKAFISTYEMYLSSWLSDIKDMTTEDTEDKNSAEQIRE